MKRFKWTMISIFSLGFLIMHLQENGFCIDKFSYLDELYTEQELIDQAIAYKIKRIPGAIVSLNGEREIKIIPYKTMEEFKQKNPNCCRLTRQLPEDKFPEEYGYVEIKYLRFYENDIRPPEKFRSFIPYNSCGEITSKR